VDFSITRSAVQYKTELGFVMDKKLHSFRISSRLLRMCKVLCLRCPKAHFNEPNRVLAHSLAECKVTCELYAALPSQTAVAAYSINFIYNDAASAPCWNLEVHICKAEKHCLHPHGGEIKREYPR